jgi:hypothetical protein
MSRIVAGILLIISISACYYDSKEYLFPDLNTSCNMDSVTYSGTIQPVLDQYCYRCHSNADASLAGNNIKLEDYSDVVIRVNDQSLYGSIAHQSGYSPMPKNGGKLDNCFINQLSAWIDQGAPGN